MFKSGKVEKKVTMILDPPLVTNGRVLVFAVSKGRTSRFRPVPDMTYNRSLNLAQSINHDFAK